MTELVDSITHAVLLGDLTLKELSARKLAKFLGKTTGVIYHHWGCLDGFLYQVAQGGFAHLREYQHSAENPSSACRQFVAFGLDYPAMYHLMFDHVYDWKAIRRKGLFDGSSPGMQMWDGLVGQVEALGSVAPDADARLLYASLHGLVSLARSGRANVGELGVTDREMALALAEQLPQRLFHPEN
jgi:hypothetical protein